MAGARTFDHDEAKRLWAAGWRREDIAKHFGVSEGAIEWAVADMPSRRRSEQALLRFPPDLRRALQRMAKAEHRSFNSQVIKLLADAVDWHFYEEGEDTETIFAHPVARHIRRSA
jgi:hypothetical protein